jgi:hypothetical protein
MGEEKGEMNLSKIPEKRFVFLQQQKSQAWLLIPATQEVTIGESQSKVSPGKSCDPI